MSTPDALAVADSTDWLSTPLAAIAPIESSLRCQVCKDFYRTPMMTSCSHTFCSLCIRRYLSAEGKCPVCREPDQEIKLRRNWTVEELVANFTSARAGILSFAKRTAPPALEDIDSGRPQKRRKIATSNASAQPTSGERRSTRSQSRRAAFAASQETNTSFGDEVADSEEGSICALSPQPAKPSSDNREPHDGLVACPCCGRRMKETVINTHLDRCINGEATPPPPLTSSSPTPQPQFSPVKITKPLNPPKQLDRLPTLNYSVMNENALRKKLKELGIPNHGSKELMRKRHTEWVNLWNANCDSRNPVTKQKLLAELDTWERTLGRHTDRAPSGVMIKEFDRDGYVRSNKRDFEDLIAQARAKRKVVVEDRVEACRQRPGQAKRMEEEVDGGESRTTDDDPPTLNGTTDVVMQTTGGVKKAEANGGHVHVNGEDNQHVSDLPLRMSQAQQEEQTQDTETNGTPRRKQPMFV